MMAAARVFYDDLSAFVVGVLQGTIGEEDCWVMVADEEYGQSPAGG
jgi:hypothetical protein